MPSFEFSFSSPARSISSICACGCFLAGLLSRLCLWLGGWLQCCLWWQLLHCCGTSHLGIDLSSWTLLASSCQEFIAGLKIIWYVNTFFIISKLLLPQAMQRLPHNSPSQVFLFPQHGEGWLWSLSTAFSSFRPTSMIFPLFGLNPSAVAGGGTTAFPPSGAPAVGSPRLLLLSQWRKMHFLAFEFWYDPLSINGEIKWFQSKKKKSTF